MNKFDPRTVTVQTLKIIQKFYRSSVQLDLTRVESNSEADEVAKYQVNFVLDDKWLGKYVLDIKNNKK